LCIGFADEENCDNRETRWLSYCSAISIGLGGLLLFTSHWTYSLSSELQLPTAYVQYGYSTYLIVTSAVISLLSMSLVLWRIVSMDVCVMINFKKIEFISKQYLRRVYYNPQPKVNRAKRRRSKKLNRRL
jgi:hypothetical protein